ncbi:MAG TPA: transglycosylase domain-containing protein [Mesorhizobium sp.]|nr:transglycosylase domain-containing protein [Mesorhizobium sp.]
MLKVWLPSVVEEYGVSRQTTVERVVSNRLVVDLKTDASQPWNASVEEAMFVELEDVPPVMVDAVLNSEDRRFFWHPGIDPIGVANAVLSHLIGNARGGSTITQQLAKNVYVGNARSLKRKRDEAAIAIWLEMNFSKSEILELYLNTPFMGEETKGIEAAARHYFGYSFKASPAAQKPFTPEMAAKLAVTIKDPTSGNPNKKRKNEERASYLLSAMRERGVDALATIEAAAKSAAPKHKPWREHHLDSRFQYARDIAVGEVNAILGRSDRKVEVTSFYKSEVQLYVERAVEQYASRFKKAGYGEPTVIVVDNRTGGIAAILSPPNPSFYPGSTLKPFVTLCGLVEHGMDEDTLVLDEPFGVPPIGNNDGRYLGEISVSDALAKSRNPPFVRMLLRWGPECPNTLLKAMGSQFRFGGAKAREMALGSEPVRLMDVLQTYVTIASCGRITTKPRLVEEIRDARSGKVLHRPAPSKHLEPGPMLTAFDQLHSMLMHTASEGGTASGSKVFVTDVAAKTGTSDQNRQVTLITFTSKYTVLASVRAEQLKKIKRALTGHDLVPLVHKINANIHHQDEPNRLGCRSEVIVAEADPGR